MKANLKSVLERAYIYATYIAVLAIPFTEDISTISIGIWALLGLFQIKPNQLNLKDRTVRHQLILPFYYLLTIIALFYTQNISSGLSNIERKASLLIVPLILVFTSPVLFKHYEKLLRVFVLSVISASVICLVLAFCHSISFGEEGLVFNAAVVMKDKSFLESNNYGGNFFFHQHLSIFRQSSYFAIYICYSLVLIIISLVSDSTSKRKTVAKILIILYLVAFLFLLSSRISYIYLVIVLLSSLVFYFKRIKLWINVALVSFLLIFVFVTAKLNYRMINLFNNDFRNSSIVELSKGTNSLKRVVIWKLIYQNEEGIQILGTGPGDVYEELSNVYYKAGLKDELTGLNAHNQFIQSYLGHGIVGLVVLLALFAPLLSRNAGLLSGHIQLLLLTFIFFIARLYEGA